MIACDVCGGSGYVNDSAGHLDICDACMGLGLVEAPAFSDDPEAVEERRQIKKVRNLVIYIYAGVISLLLLVEFLITLLA